MFLWPVVPIMLSAMAVPVLLTVPRPPLFQIFGLLVSAAVGAGLAFWAGRSRLRHDLAEQREGVAEARQRLRDLARIIPELVVEVTTQGEVQFLNESARSLLAPSEGQDTSTSMMSLVAPRDRAVFAQMQAVALGGEMPTSRRLHLLMHDGGCLPVRAIAAPILADGEGTVVGMRAVFADMRGELASSQALDQRHSVEIAVTEFIKALALAGDKQWTVALDGALASLRQLVALDHCALLHLGAEPAGEAEYEWSGMADQMPCQLEKLGLLRSQGWLTKALAAGKIFHAEGPEDLEGSPDTRAEVWQQLAVCSLLVVPMFGEGEVMGLMVFDTSTGPANWGEDDIRLLETLSGMILGTWQRRLARRAQRAATQRFMDIIEFLPDATFVVDNQGRIMAWNRAMSELTGKGSAEMVGQGHQAYAIPFLGERRPLLVDHFADVNPAEFESRYQFLEVTGDKICGELFVPFLGDGRGAYLWCTASPLYDSEGQIVGAIESLRDVTYRKVSELALREGEERYRRLAETLNDGLVIIDAAGLISFVNDRLCAMCGFPRDEIINHPVSEFWPDSFGDDWDPAAWAGWNLAGGDALEVSLTCRDGHLMPARVSPSALQAAGGEFQGGFAVITDLTSVREAEARYRVLNENLEKKVVESTRDLLTVNEALRRSEGRYRRIIESLREGYIFYSRDTAGQFTYVSPSFRDVLGFNSLDTVVSHFAEWYGQPRNAGARLTAEKNSLGFKQPSYELQVEAADGGARVLEILEVPEFDRNGHLMSVEGVMHDVTEERRILQVVREAQAKLVESEKLAALGGLMAGLSHEINTPIGVGVTASSYLSEVCARCEESYRAGQLTEKGFESFLAESRESTTLIQKNLSRAADLMQNFKQVAVDQSAGRERTFNLAHYFEEVIQSLSPQLKNTGFVIRCECPPDLELRCDPGALYQILSNLVFNSLKHGFDGLLVGEILLRADRRDDQIVLSYSDNGNGMGPEQLARLYEPFYTTRRGRGGTGLGMHIVYNNVTQTLGGSITCVSKPGRGTRFTIAIPLLAEVQHG